LETPDLNKIRILARSNDHNDFQQLESYCYQFAEKFDDFNEEWVPMDKLSVELPQNIENEEYFLKEILFSKPVIPPRNTWSLYVISG